MISPPPPAPHQTHVVYTRHLHNHTEGSYTTLSFISLMNAFVIGRGWFARS